MNLHIPAPVRALSAIVLTASLVVMTGCASIVHSGSRIVSIASTPPGAKVTIFKAGTTEAVHSGQTPLTVTLDQKKSYFSGQGYTLKLELPGYKNAEVQLKPELSGWYFGNIIFGGLIGMIVVDPLTGAMWNLTPEKIEQSLSPDHAQVIRDNKGFVVVLLEQTTASERANMVRIN